MLTFSWSKYEKRLSRIAQGCCVENVHLEGGGYRLCNYGEVVRTLVKESSIQIIFLLKQRLQDRSSNLTECTSGTATYRRHLDGQVHSKIFAVLLFHADFVCPTTYDMYV